METYDVLAERDLGVRSGAFRSDPGGGIDTLKTLAGLLNCCMF